GGGGGGGRGRGRRGPVRPTGAALGGHLEGVGGRRREARHGEGGDGRRLAVGDDRRGEEDVRRVPDGPRADVGHVERRGPGQDDRLGGRRLDCGRRGDQVAGRRAVRRRRRRRPALRGRAGVGPLPAGIDEGVLAVGVGAAVVGPGDDGGDVLVGLAERAGGVAGGGGVGPHDLALEVVRLAGGRLVRSGRLALGR